MPSHFEDPAPQSSVAQGIAISLSRMCAGAGSFRAPRIDGTSGSLRRQRGVVYSLLRGLELDIKESTDLGADPLLALLTSGYVSSQETTSVASGSVSARPREAQGVLKERSRHSRMVERRCFGSIDG